jgi:formate-dependent nitrite reductase cytochrome c552 subunit
MVKKLMVYYTEETPGVNKRMVAGYYLFLCLIGFAILLGPTGSGIPISLIGTGARDGHELAQPHWADTPEECGDSDCHNATFEYWNETSHATHMYLNESNNMVRIGAYAWFSYAFFNSSCAECHVSGYNATDGSYDALGVNCFACHTGDPVVDYSGDACATCHRPSGEEHPHQYVPWENSAHANSLTDLRASGHANDDCMHCMSTEGFIDQMGTFDPDDVTLNAVSCPACHAVHANWSVIEDMGMIRAATASELCGTCHVGARHTTYQTWTGGPHALAGVDCIDCHGYDYTNASEIADSYFLNHTFVVQPDKACGQPEGEPGCHDAEGQAEWALNQLETYQTSYEDLTEEILAEVAAFEPIVLAYNDTAGSDQDLVTDTLDAIDAAGAMVSYYGGDGSEGFHHPHQIFGDLNAAFADLLDAKAHFYEMTGGTSGPAPLPVDTLIIVAGAAGGIVVGLLLGVLVGRRR